MFDFLQFIYELRHKPLGFIVLAATIFIIDRIFRNLITSQVKRLFKVNGPHELAAYEERQIRIEEREIRIERMLQTLMQKEGITWNAPTLPLNSEVTQTKRKKSYSLPWADIFHAHVAKPYTTWRRKIQMSNINRGILLPLLSAIALFVKQAFGYEVPTETIDMAANIILYLIFFLGLFMNVTKKKKVEPKQQEEVEGYYH